MQRWHPSSYGDDDINQHPRRALSRDAELVHCCSSSSLDSFKLRWLAAPCRQAFRSSPPATKPAASASSPANLCRTRTTRLLEITYPPKRLAASTTTIGEPRNPNSCKGLKMLWRFSSGRLLHYTCQARRVYVYRLLFSREICLRTREKESASGQSLYQAQKGLQPEGQSPETRRLCCTGGTRSWSGSWAGIQTSWWRGTP